MPEGYTHVRTAQHAAQLAGYTPASPQAFATGANGPDILFVYQLWKPKARRTPDLPTLGNIMHRDKTGAFVLDLVQNAATPAQKDYALGFLTHYAADSTVHPYVYACMAQGAPYHCHGGHGYFEIALDSWLHRQDWGTPRVDPQHANPKLTGAARAESFTLLQASLARVYGCQVPLLAISDAFELMRLVRVVTPSRTPLHLRRALFWLAEPLLGGRGFITGHCSPARLKGLGEKDAVKLPRPWLDAFSGREYDEDIPMLLSRAEHTAAAYITAALRYWQGQITLQQLGAVLGSKSYSTGMETGPEPIECTANA